MYAFGGQNVEMGRTFSDLWALTCPRVPVSMHYWDTATRLGECHWAPICNATSCGSPPAPRAGATGVLDDAGRALVFGGYDVANGTNARGSSGSGAAPDSAGATYYNDLFALDLRRAGSAWAQLCPPGTPCAAAAPRPRAGHAAVVLRDRLVVIGGHDGTSVLNDLWVLPLGEADPTALRWVPVQSVGGPGPVTGHTAVRLSDAEALMFGGRSRLDAAATGSARVWRLQLVPLAGALTAKWTAVCDEARCGPAPGGRYGHAAALGAAGMLVAGGRPGARQPCLEDVWMLRLPEGAAPAWAPLCGAADAGARPCGAGPAPRARHTAVAFAGGDFVFFGGAGDGAPYADVWRLRHAASAPPPAGPSRGNRSFSWWALPLGLGLVLSMTLAVSVTYNVLVHGKGGLDAIPHYAWALALGRRVANRLVRLLGRSEGAMDYSPVATLDPDPVDWTDFDVDDDANYL